MSRRSLLSLAALGGGALVTGARPVVGRDPDRHRPAGCWQGTSGVADVATGAPVPAGARFRIGSVTKTFTGRSYADEIHHRIVRPLGLGDTSVTGDDPAVPGPHAHGYQMLDGELVDVTRWNQSSTPAAGDMTADPASRLVCAVNATDAKAEGQAPTIGRLIPTALRLR